VLVHTGQHYDYSMSRVFFEQLQLPEPDYNLGVGSETFGAQMARMLERLEKVMSAERPDWTIVYGDTNSTLGGALIASRLKLAIAHVEAGCRNADLNVPEEQNRIVADHLSHLLLAPSGAALANLHREGIATDCDPRHRRAVNVGDVMYDALLLNLPDAEKRVEQNLRKFRLRQGKYYVLTLHRPENTDDETRLRQIIDATATLDMPVLFPVHPRTKRIIASSGISLWGNLRPVAPLGYLDMLAVEQNASRVLTDSGGIQKEAFYLQVPCITLRERTEWPETIDLGANRICKPTTDAIHEAVAANHYREWLSDNPYGDGEAAQKIVREILEVSNS